MSTGPLVIVTDRVGADDEGELVIGLVQAHQAAGGFPVSIITWDGGPRVGLLDGARRREVDAINKWWLPKTLVRFPPTRPVGRAMRQARVRWWWRRAGSDPVVVIVGRCRPELEHYLPPASTVERVVDDEVGTRGTSVWRPLVRSRAGVRPGERLVTAWGPPTWAAGIDQFIQLAWWSRRRDAGVARFVWCHPRDHPPGPKVRHDIEALGVDDLVTFVAADGAPPLAARGAEASVGCSREPSGASSSGLSGPLVAYGPDGAAPRFGRPEALVDALWSVLAGASPEAG